MSNNTARDIHSAPTLNWLISQGAEFEAHPFKFGNGLLIVYKHLQTLSYVATKGDMKWDLMTPKGTYSSSSVYFDPHTPETVAEEVAKRFELVK